MVGVAFPVSCAAAFDYLVDPRNRPAWQSTLRRVEAVDGDPRVGQTWVDVTRAGPRPRLETTELDRPRRWTERGAWRGIAATLSLDLVETATGCDVVPTVELRGRGPAAPVAWVLGRVAPYAVLADLRSAARLLSKRA